MLKIDKFLEKYFQHELIMLLLPLVIGLECFSVSNSIKPNKLIKKDANNSIKVAQILITQKIFFENIRRNNQSRPKNNQKWDHFMKKGILTKKDQKQK